MENEKLKSVLDSLSVSSELKAQILSGMQGDGETGTLIETEQTINLVHLRSPTAPEALSLSAEPSSPAKRYTDLGILGAGGMGEVRLVHDAELSRQVAMKVLRSELKNNPNECARFVEEAQICAQLQHPNIVPIHDVGVLPDGCPYFTMKVVKGRSLSEVIRHVHHFANPFRFEPTDDGWTFRRLIDVFHQVCQAVAFAHSKGVLHRDLKPQNIMLGEFGEVMILDWGIAKILKNRHFHPQSSQGEAISSNRSALGLYETTKGSVTGTPAYMSPEQAMGLSDAISERSDVYALGALLYEILIGRPPYRGKDGRDILNQVLSGPPKPLRQTEDIPVLRPNHPPLPDDLISACETAMNRSLADRFASAAAFEQVISDWLEGARQKEKALNIVAEAEELGQNLLRLEHDINTLQAEAEAALKNIPNWADERVKGRWWDKEQAAHEKQEEWRWLFSTQEQILHTALRYRPELEVAHLKLIDRYRAAHAQAEDNRDPALTASQAVRLRHHAMALPEDHPVRSRQLHYLKGTGALTLHLPHHDVGVYLEQYVAHHRRLVTDPIGFLGHGTLHQVPLEMGSYRLRLIKKGHQDVIYPICIGREEHWTGLNAQDEPAVIELPPTGVLSESECYVAAGRFWAGGDERAPSGLSRRLVWQDAFVMATHPVTNAQYLVFLNALLEDGREGEALQWVPRERSGQHGQQGASIYGRDPNGHFVLVPDTDGVMWNPDWPVCSVDWHCANAYAAWYSEHTGKSWRLPTELEWEKAARGVDGRWYPWGDGFDPSYACVLESHQDGREPALISDYPIDESVYGVRGMAGNMRDWTASYYRKDWTAPLEKTHYVGRGGNWHASKKAALAAHRHFYNPTYRSGLIGFRLCRDY